MNQLHPRATWATLRPRTVLRKGRASVGFYPGHTVLEGHPAAAILSCGKSNANRPLFTLRSSHRFLLAGVSCKRAGDSEGCTASARTFSAEIRVRKRYMHADRFDDL
jgi:hypothetical protein